MDSSTGCLTVLRRAAASRTRRAKDTGAVKMKIRGVRIMKKASGPIVLAGIGLELDIIAAVVIGGASLAGG